MFMPLLTKFHHADGQNNNDQLTKSSPGMPYQVIKTNHSGWSRNQPIVISYASNQGLTISSGTRIYVDRLSTNGFTLGSISVYGKDNPKSPSTTYAGDISFNVIYGNPASSPIYYLPLVTLVGMGGIVGGLLILKRRKAT
jgi:hypothetical protein